MRETWGVRRDKSTVYCPPCRQTPGLRAARVERPSTASSTSFNPFRTFIPSPDPAIRAWDS